LRRSNQPVRVETADFVICDRPPRKGEGSSTRINWENIMALEIKLLNYGDIELESGFLVAAPAGC
jgi:hypothetical protein